MTNQTKNKLAPWQLLLIGSLSMVVVIAGGFGAVNFGIPMLSSMMNVSTPDKQHEGLFPIVKNKK